MEGVVLAMVCLSPWVFGAVSAAALSYLYAGVGVLLVLWAARVLLEKQWVWKWCPLSWCLASQFFLAVAQLAPLPGPLHGGGGLIRQLLPAEPERLPEGAPRLTGGQPAGGAPSLYPGATRREAVKLLAVWLLFVAVRNNIAGPAALFRLSLAVLVNGALLALFALVQFFSSPTQLIYWTYPTDGQVFGPFVCRNHYPFYINMAVGLGVGLLLALQRLRKSRLRREGIAPEPSGRFGALLLPLHDPAVLWVSVALALMIGSVFVSVSRGGVLAVLGSAAVALGVKAARGRRLGPFELGVGVLLAFAALAAWFGVEQVEQRLHTIWTGTPAGEGRFDSWRNVLPLALQYPLWGTGLGTYQYVEPLRRGVGELPTVVWEHAHNEYLEALIEGGLPRLALSLLAVGVVYRLGWRALRRHRRRLGGGLALGALLAFTTLVLHSAVDFGVHIPAVTVLAVVLCAHLADLGKARRRRSRREHGEAHPWPESPAARRLIPVAGALALVCLALVLYGAGSRAARAESLHALAERMGASTDLRVLERQLAYLQAAVRASPEDAILHFDLARALVDQYEKEHARLTQGFRPAAAAGVAASLAPPGGAALPAAAVAIGRAAGPDDDPLVELDAAGLALRHKYLAPALAHGVRARDLCPLLGIVQLWLADQAPRFPRAEGRAAYLARATLLRPTYAPVWYLAGEQDFADGRFDLAWRNWRQALTLADEHLGPILSRARTRLGIDELLGRVLPDNPERLLKAATALYPQDQDRPLRRPLLEKALALATRPQGSPRAEDYRLQAQILLALARPSDAVRAYQSAVALGPRHLDWRMQLAELLYTQGRLPEAREQLAVILTANARHREAGVLLETVERELGLRP